MAADLWTGESCSKHSEVTCCLHERSCSSHQGWDFHASSPRPRVSFVTWAPLVTGMLNPQNFPLPCHDHGFRATIVTCANMLCITFHALRFVNFQQFLEIVESQSRRERDSTREIDEVQYVALMWCATLPLRHKRAKESVMLVPVTTVQLLLLTIKL